MLNVHLRQMAERFLPNYLRTRLDPFEAKVADRLLSFASTLPKGSWVLDAGAGQCRYARYFKRHRYVPVDNAVGDPNWDYSQLSVMGDLEHIPMAASAFDAAVSIVVLEHTREPQRVLTEIARVLRPGGKLFLVVPNQWEVHQAPIDYYRFTRHGVEYLLSKSAFNVLEVEAIGGFFWLMSRRCINLLTFFQGGLKWPIFFLLAPFFGILFPIILYPIDRLDQQQNFTLGYCCVAERQTQTESSH